MFHKFELFPSSIIVSAALHVSVFGIATMLPAPVQYPVQRSPNSIDMVMIEEAATSEQPMILGEIIELAKEDALQAPVEQEEIKEEKEEAQESEASLGATSEAAPLEFANLAPSYPALARRKGWEGVVHVQVKVEKDGFPSSVIVALSSGFSILDEAAVEAIEHWRFKPAQSGPITFSSTIQIPVRFQLVERD